MLVPADNVHEIQTTVTQTSQVQSLSSVTPSVAGNSIPPMTGQCTSLVLLEYRKYLQSYYKTRDLAAADKYLPTLDTPYISLAIVTSHSSNQDESDEFTKATLHGGVDQILKIKKPIVFQDLLTPSEGSNKPVRFILVEGPPGIGKSTFAWEVCRRWEDIPSLKAYDAVVLLKLHEWWVLNATSLAKLFRYPEFSKTISKELNQSQGLNLLLILDGFDEVSHSFHDNSVIKHILNRVLLPECTIILTTRPSAKSTLEINFQPFVNKHLEIIGFPEEERVKYITEVFSKQPELQVNFLKYMFNVPHIKSMMYIPLNCAIIAKVYSESKHSSRLATRTRTQLYKALIHSFLVRYMSLNGGGIACSSTLPEYLPIKEMELFKTLAKFAFDSYHEGETKKVTFFEEDIPRGLVYFGLMNESTEMYVDKGMERSYSFLHLSLQEYLAAWHIANSYSVHFQVAYHYVVSDSKLPSLFKGTMLKPETFPYYKGDNTEESALIIKLEPISSTLREPAVFLAGITGLKCESVQKNPWESYLNDLNDKIMLTQDSSAIGDYASISGLNGNSIALRSLYEAQNTSILASISFDKNLYIGHDPYDSYAVSYCISHCSNEVSLDIRINESSSSIEAFCRGLHDHCKSSVLRVNRLTVNIADVDAKSMHWLADTIKTFMTGVKHIKFVNFMKSIVSFQSLFPLQVLVKLELLEIISYQSTEIFLLTHMLPSLRNLKSVRFSTVIGHMTTTHVLPSQKKLKSLSFSVDRLCNTPSSHPICQALENSVTKLELNVKLPYSSYDVKSPTALFINDLLTSILRSKLITYLSLPNISHENMANVYAIIIQCPNLAHLELRRCRLGYDGILYICNALRYNSSVKHIVIHDYEQDIDPDRASYPLKEVPLPNRATCTDIILGLNDILKENNTLEKLSISTGLFQDWRSGKLIKLAQFRIRNGTAHGLRRSYSLSDLTPLNTTVSHVVDGNRKIDITKAFLTKYHIHCVGPRQRKKQRMKMCYNISFTAPDTDILTSFSHLDPRLKKSLGITDLQLLEVQRELIRDMKLFNTLRQTIKQMTKIV